jgi:uncharacterized protein (DUF2062 family)
MNALAVNEPVQKTPRPFWRRRVLDPVVAQLRQGISPEKIALTIALGAVLGIFPVLGSTTALCLLAGLALRLNQPVLHLVNYLVYPLQLLFIPAFIRIGESLFRAPHIPFSIPQLIEKFRASPPAFFREFAMTFAHCISAWLLIAPGVAAIVYFTLRPVLKRVAGQPRA